ncbi:MAG: hypothetical protein M3133_10565, partial [Actinomycetota bacterium]|nr:hypothetical protein [Actinomycetota bacterium]
LYDIIKNAEPLTAPVVHKLPSNLRRHYEKMARLPDGFIVPGDALCSFNPIYGQGMTASALEADTLHRCLAADERRRGGMRGVPGPGFPRCFFREAAKIVEIPWMLAAGADFQYPETQGAKRPGTDLINWYMGQVHRAATRDPEVYHAFLHVMNLMRPPAALFHPRIVLRVMSGRTNGHRRSQGSLRLAEAT